jgi:hypothetical protein
MGYVVGVRIVCEINITRNIGFGQKGIQINILPKAPSINKSTRINAISISERAWHTDYVDINLLPKREDLLSI